MVCKTDRPILSDRCPVLSVCNIGVLWPNGSTDQDETWHAGSFGPGHIVLAGDPVPPPKRGTAPQFSAHICCGQMAAWIKMSLGMEVGIGPRRLCVRWGPRSPVLKGEQSPPPPKFSANVYCGQTAGWMKMVLGMEVGPGDFVLDGDPVPFPKRGRSPLPNFRPISIVAKRLHASKCHLV